MFYSVCVVTSARVQFSLLIGFLDNTLPFVRKYPTEAAEHVLLTQRTQVDIA